MAQCLVVQPIHTAGLVALEQAGITPILASSSDTATVAREIMGAVAVVTRDAGLKAAAMEAAPMLRIIASHGAGTNAIDVGHARKRGIIVVNTPGANARSVAEHAIGLMLAVMRRSVEADRAVREGSWAFRYAGGMGELHGKTLGLVGFGAIARITAHIAGAGFGMQVFAWSPSTPGEAFTQSGVTRVDGLEALLGMSDVVSLHRPLRPDTVGMIDAAALAAMRPGAILVNTARGELVDATALREALVSGRLRGAGLDVFAVEPPSPEDPLLQLANVVLAPHSGGATEDALRGTALRCATQIIDVLAGRAPAHPV